MLPIYVSVGLAWESAERAMVSALLTRDAFRAHVRPLVSLSLNMRDVYAATHWAVQGRPPAYHTPDEDVYLPGRNIVLLGKAGVYCAAAHINRLVLGTLAHNPFPDATPTFRSAMAEALSLGLGRTIRIEAPYAKVSKPEIIRRGVALGVPFELTLSCMKPVRKVQEVQGVQTVRQVQRVRQAQKARKPQEPFEPLEPLEPVEPLFLHCGTCSKCRERHDAFLEAGVPDRTDYVDVTYVGA